MDCSVRLLLPLMMIECCPPLKSIMEPEKSANYYDTEQPYRHAADRLPHYHD